MLCKVCGEHWDLDSVHEAINEQFPDHQVELTHLGKAPAGAYRRKNGFWFDQVAYEERYFNPMIARFRKEGCVALDPLCKEYCIPDTSERHKNNAAIAAAFESMLGDDVDGVEAMMEDYNTLEN